MPALAWHGDSMSAWGDSFGTKTKKDRERESVQTEINILTVRCANQEKHILSRAIIRDASSFQMVNLKKEHEDTDRKLQILKRKLVRMDGGR